MFRVINNKNPRIGAGEILRETLPFFNFRQLRNQLSRNLLLSSVQGVFIGWVNLPRKRQPVLCSERSWIAYDSLHPSSILASEVKIKRLS